MTFPIEAVRGRVRSSMTSGLSDFGKNSWPTKPIATTESANSPAVADSTSHFARIAVSSSAWKPRAMRDG